MEPEGTQIALGVFVTENFKQHRFETTSRLDLTRARTPRFGALLAALEPFARHNINLRKIESRPIHGQPWAYSFIIEIEADKPELLDAALAEARKSTNDLRVLGLYAAAKTDPTRSNATVQK